MYVDIYIYIYIYIYIHTHTHTHTHARARTMSKHVLARTRIHYLISECTYMMCFSVYQVIIFGLAVSSLSLLLYTVLLFQVRRVQGKSWCEFAKSKFYGCLLP